MKINIMKVNEIFYSIQGEGTQVGFPTVFLRLFACDLRCYWCDSMYAVEGHDFSDMEFEEVVKKILKFDCNRLCITGGEPLIQKDDVEKITEYFLDKDYSIVLETSGHKEPPQIFSHKNCVISMDCKCPSSKMEKRMDFSLYEKLEAKDQLKFVIADEVDFEYAKNILQNYNIIASIIFQQVYGESSSWLAETVLKESINNIRVIPQIHKVFWGEKRGV